MMDFWLIAVSLWTLWRMAACKRQLTLSLLPLERPVISGRFASDHNPIDARR